MSHHFVRGELTPVKPIDIRTFNGGYPCHKRFGGPPCRGCFQFQSFVAAWLLRVPTSWVDVVSGGAFPFLHAGSYLSFQVFFVFFRSVSKLVKKKTAHKAQKKTPSSNGSCRVVVSCFCEAWSSLVYGAFMNIMWHVRHEDDPGTFVWWYICYCQPLTCLQLINM